MPIPPEAAKLDLAHTLCIHGLDETDSLCPQIDGKSALSIALPGAHHFNGDYKRVAAEIVAHLPGINAPAQSP
jgi:type IV secretory pathway VirJ component